MARKTAREDPIERARDAKRESKFVEFKESFDPKSDGEWVELLKDFAALANSGGGVVIIGVNDNGTRGDADVSDVLKLDAAKIADKLFRYTGDNFDGFEVHEVQRNGGSSVAAIVITGVTEAPLIFNRPGTYATGPKEQKTAFSKGVAYFRHGAKSEPGTSNDHRKFIDRRIAEVRRAWLGGIKKVVTAPDDFELARVRETDEAGQPTRVQLTTDPNAPIYGRLSHDETHPYRLTELLAELHDRLGRGVTEYDVRCVRRAHKISAEARPEYCVQPKYSSMQYSEAFLDWLADEHDKNPKVFSEARRQQYREMHPQ